MKKKLKITRTTAYLLSSIIYIPYLIAEKFQPELIAFNIGMYISIYMITEYFSKNYSLKGTVLLAESILTTIASFIVGVIIATPIALINTFDFRWIFALLFIGVISCFLIGLVLFIINYTIILLLKTTDAL